MYLPVATLKEGNNFNYQVAPHFYGMGGYKFNLIEGNMLALEPSVFVKSDVSSTQLDVNALVHFCKYFWAGASYRWADAIVTMAGAKWKWFKIGYSYDITTSILNKHSTGSHEVMLGYMLEKWKKKERKEGME